MISQLQGHIRDALTAAGVPEKAVMFDLAGLEDYKAAPFAVIVPETERVFDGRGRIGMQEDQGTRQYVSEVLHRRIPMAVHVYHKDMDAVEDLVFSMLSAVGRGVAVDDVFVPVTDRQVQWNLVKSRLNNLTEAQVTLTFDAPVVQQQTVPELTVEQECGDIIDNSGGTISE